MASSSHRLASRDKTAIEVARASAAEQRSDVRQRALGAYDEEAFNMIERRSNLAIMWAHAHMTMAVPY